MHAFWAVLESAINRSVRPEHRFESIQAYRILVGEEVA